MTKEEIDNLSCIEFEIILKACLLRLQTDNQHGDVIEVKHDGYNESSIIIPYVNHDASESMQINSARKKFYIQHHTGVDINTIIK